jgi:hypothetical protein
LEIIGEAVKQPPAAIRAQHRDVDWKRIAGFGDILAHEYFGIDMEIVWDILQRKLPALATELCRRRQLGVAVRTTANKRGAAFKAKFSAGRIVVMAL